MARCLTQYWPSHVILDIDSPRESYLSKKTVQPITHLETKTAENKERFRLFDLSIHELFTDEIIVTEGAKPNPAS